MIQLSQSRLRTMLSGIAPVIVTGLLALTAFLLMGRTPFIRGLGMAVTIGAMGLMLRQFGTGLAIAGSLAFAFSAAFWSQTGGTEIASSALFGFVLLISMVGGGLLIFLGRLSVGRVAVGVIIIASLAWLIVGSPRSLRVTTLLSASLLLVLIDVLISAHPHPHKPVVTKPDIKNITALLLFFVFGILNDPLFILLAPAVILGLTLSKVAVPRWYWGLIIVAIVIGTRGVIIQYLDSGWWLYPADRAEAAGIRVPYVMADGWRQASRWLYLIDLLRNQFTEIGVALGILGLSRLSRWYPPVGVVTLVAFASYVLFGLVYFGKDSIVLLLPMLMILVLWMTYAVYALSQWLQKSLMANAPTRWLATAGFMLLPLLLLIRIAGLDSA